MILRAFVAGLALLLVPAIADARCGKHAERACADGLVWDSTTSSCVTPVHS
ncbi:MAG: hypothetical protein WCZ72_12925 [Gemmobacter sp.]